MSRSPRRPLIEALEPRLLFSATTDIAVFDDGHSDWQSLAEAAEQLDLVSIYMADTPLIESKDVALQSAFDTDPQIDIHPNVQSTATTLIFIDTAVADYQTLVEDIRNRMDADFTAIIFLDANKDGITQIGDCLANASGISAIHIISHGVTGNLLLGNQVLNENNIDQYAQQFMSWSMALSEEADILLYGCDLAANQSGINLLRHLSDLTGADVAASNDLTGNSLEGGDWVLEIKYGQIDAPELFSVGSYLEWQGLLAGSNPPSGTDISIPIAAGSAYTIYAASFGFHEAVDSPWDVMAGVKVTTLPTNGTLTLSGTAITAGQTVAKSDIDFGFLKYTPDAAAVAAGASSYTFQVQDNGASNTLDTTPNTMSFTISGAVNQAPIGTNNVIDTQEDTPKVLAAANFGFSDPDGNSFAGVKITAISGGGTFSVTGSGPVSVNQFVTIADINAGKLIFTPTANENATNYALLTFQVRDNGGTAGGGVDTDQSANNLQIDVSYVNDDPVNTVPAGPITTAEDTTVAISGVSISDIDDYNLWDVEVTLSVSHGVLSVSGGSAAISGSGTATVVLTGTMGQINSTLAATLNYTPASSFFGADVFTIVTNDKGAGRTGDIDKTDTDTVAINVTSVNDAPIVTNAIPDQSTNEESFYSYTFPANTFNDVDGNTLIYTATLSDGNPLPPWLNFNAGTRTFSGVPDDGDIGTISIRVTANDGFGGTGNDTFDLTIVNINDLPFVNIPIPNQNATEDAAFSYTFPSNTFGDGDLGTSFTYTVTLVDGSPLPGWLSFDSATRTFLGTPANDDVGTLSVRVTANDGAGATVSDNFDILIANTNDAPTLVNQIPNQNATENSLYNYTFPIDTFNDQDVGDTLTYSAQIPGGAPLPAWLSFDAATRTFSGIPSNGDVGNFTVEVIASDGTTTVSDFFDVQVENVGATNVNYESSGPSTDTQSLSAGVPLYQSFAHDSVGATYTIDSIILQVRKDPSASVQTITVSLISSTYNGTVIASDTKSSAGLNTTLSWEAFNFSSVALNDNQIYFIRVETTSNDGLVSVGIHNTNVYPNGSFHSSTGTPDPDRDLAFQVSSGVNNSPQIANPIPNQNVAEDAAFNFQFAANTFSDADGDPLTYSATMADGSALPAWLSFNAATRTFSGAPVNADVGTISIKVTADDAKGGTPATDTFDLVIANTNDAPTVANPIPNQNATEDAAFNFLFAANTFNDVDVGDTLSYSAQLAGGGALPAWLSFDAATRTFSGTPTNAFVGTVSIDVIANDGNGGTVTDTFDIVVANTNDAPTVVFPIADQSATENTAFNFTFGANVFADPDVGETLTYSAQLVGGGALPAWLSFNSATRSFSGTPALGDVGSINIEVTANDGQGGTVSDVFVLTVTGLPVNTPPFVQSAIADQVAAENQRFDFSFPVSTFVDPEGDPLSYSVQLVGGGSLPAWLSFDAATRSFSGTPTAGDIGSINVLVTASDANGGSISDSFVIVVNNVNDAPVLVNPPANQTALEDLPFSVTFPASMFTDADAGTSLVYSAQLSGGAPLPNWLVFDAATLSFRGTPTQADVGNLSIHIIASDGIATATAQFELTVVQVNDVPETTGSIVINNVEDAAGDQVDLWALFSDQETATRNLVFSVLSNSNPALVTNTTIDLATGKLQLNYGANQFGSSDVVVRVQDEQGAWVDALVRIHIASVNDVPVSSGMADISVKAGTAPQQMNLRTVFSDVENATTLNWTLMQNSNNSVVPSIQIDPATGLMTLSFASQIGGESTITLRAKDSDGAWVETSFKVTVAALDKPPVTVPPVEPPTPPTTPPTMPPTTPPTTDGPKTPDGADTDLPEIPGELPNQGGNNSLEPLLPDDLGAQQIIVETGDSNHTDAVINDKSSRDYERAEEANSDGNVPLTTLTASPNLAGLIAPDAGFAPWEEADFDNEVRRLRAQMDEAMVEEQDRRAVVAGLTFSVTTGFLIWSLRASSLLLTMMSMLPLWRGLDPLPILEEVNKKKKELEQQRKDKIKEDREAHEVGYLFDQVNKKE